MVQYYNSHRKYSEQHKADVDSVNSPPPTLPPQQPWHGCLLATASEVAGLTNEYDAWKSGGVQPFTQNPEALMRPPDQLLQGSFPWPTPFLGNDPSMGCSCSQALEQAETATWLGPMISPNEKFCDSQ